LQTPPNAGDLLYIYKRGSFDLDYKSFLTKTLNQQLRLNNKDGYVFVLDKDITFQYQTRKIADFFLLYFKQDNNDRYILNNDISENQRNTIFYYLFINNYLTVFDDYSGSYYAFSTSKLAGKLCPNK